MSDEANNNNAAALERALLVENLGVAISLEKAHPDAAEDIASAAAQNLRFDAGQNNFVDRESGEPTSVRDWLKNQRQHKPHWFRTPEASTSASSSDEPTVVSKGKGIPAEDTRPTPPGREAHQDPVPTGRRVRQMSEREYADYRKQNPHARVLSTGNSGGQLTYTVDCGSEASPQQVGGQSMDEYRKWRQGQGLGRNHLPY